MKKLSLLLLSCCILLGCEAQPGKKSIINKKTVKITYLTSAKGDSILMGEVVFWGIIEKARVRANYNYQVQIGVLKQILLNMTASDIVKFDNTFTAILAKSYTSKLWGASYVINGGCSDDCFEYFREYVIAQGKKRFYETYYDPDSCADWIKSESEDNWEGIRYAASEAYKEKVGMEMPKGYMPDYILKGKLFEEATVEKDYPELAKKF